MKRTALLVLGVGSPLLLVAFLIGGGVAEWLFAVLGLLFPVALIALAFPSRKGVWILVGLALLLAGSGAGLLWLESGAPVAGPGARVVGLPPATWLMLLGLGLAPLVFTCWAYAATFDALGPTEERLRRLSAFHRSSADDAPR